MSSAFRNGFCIGTPADPIRTAGRPAPLLISWNHNPISHEGSATVQRFEINSNLNC